MHPLHEPSPTIGTEFLPAPRSMPASRSALLYLLLVGVPLAGLAAILHAGSTLQAPPALGGEWRVETREDSALIPRTFTIAQSGVHISVAFGAAALPGALSGDSLRAATPKSLLAGTPGANCYQPGTPLHLAAHVDAASRPARLTGRLSSDPTRCRSVAFTAVRAGGEGKGE